MNHKHNVYDTDLHFIIDPITREIHSDSGKVILMQLDHKSERITFELPRYIDGHDMTLCNEVEVHYINRGDSIEKPIGIDVCPIVDMQVSPDSEDIAIGSWLVTQNATRYYGDLEFNLRFACVADDGEITYQWFTNGYDKIGIEKTIFNTDVVVEDIGPDAFYVWKKDVYDMVEALTVRAETGSTEASKSEIAAKRSEQNAAVSEANAKESELNAKESELNAKESEEFADTYAKTSKSYAVGDTGFRVGENTDNSKYYSEVAQNLYRDSLTTLDTVEKSLVDLNERATGVAFYVNFATGNLEYTSPIYSFAINSDTGNLEWVVAEGPTPASVAAALDAINGEVV